MDAWRSDAGVGVSQGQEMGVVQVPGAPAPANGATAGRVGWRIEMLGFPPGIILSGKGRELMVGCRTCLARADVPLKTLCRSPLALRPFPVANA